MRSESAEERCGENRVRGSESEEVRVRKRVRSGVWGKQSECESESEEKGVKAGRWGSEGKTGWG